MRDRLDELLDEALASYVGEPRAGLERRVLRRVLHGVRSAEKRFWLWTPVFSAAVLACLFVVSYVGTRREQIPVVVGPVPIRQEVHEAKAEAPVAEKRVVRPRRAVLRKKDVFPSPTGLTEGERALLMLTQRHPETALKVVSKSSLEPIEIQLLEIRPIQTDSGQ